MVRAALLGLCLQSVDVLGLKSTHERLGVCGQHIAALQIEDESSCHGRTWRDSILIPSVNYFGPRYIHERNAQSQSRKWRKRRLNCAGIQHEMSISVER